MSPSPQPDPIPAATVVVLRDRADAPPELIVVERAAQMAFAGGALVFPGGRVDPADRVFAAEFVGDPEGNAARVAAVREAIEEAGCAIGVLPPPDAATLQRLRDALHAGASLAGALSTERLTLDLSALLPFARWLPAHAHMRIFDTRFYLARFPEGAPEPSVDGTENTRLFWASAAEVLAMCDRGDASVIFPTRRNLERLAQFGSFAHAAADAARWPIEPITPWIEQSADGARLHIPEDLGYPVTWQTLETVQRA